MLRAHRLPAVRTCLLIFGAVLLSATVLVLSSSIDPPRALAAPSLPGVGLSAPAGPGPGSSKPRARHGKSGKSSSASRSDCAAAARAVKARKACAGKRSKANRPKSGVPSKTTSASPKKAGSAPAASPSVAPAVTLAPVLVGDPPAEALAVPGSELPAPAESPGGLETPPVESKTPLAPVEPEPPLELKAPIEPILPVEEPIPPVEESKPPIEESKPPVEEEKAEEEVKAEEEKAKAEEEKAHEERAREEKAAEVEIEEEKAAEKKAEEKTKEEKVKEEVEAEEEKTKAKEEQANQEQAAEVKAKEVEAEEEKAKEEKDRENKAEEVKAEEEKVAEEKAKEVRAEEVEAEEEKAEKEKAKEVKAEEEVKARVEAKAQEEKAREVKAQEEKAKEESKAAETAAPFRFFSPTSFWNEELPANAALDPTSAAVVGAFNTEIAQEMTAKKDPTINTTVWSVPVYTVPADQPMVKVTVWPSRLSYSPALQIPWDEVPLPADARPAAGSDEHLVVWQPSTNRLWEFWRLEQTSTGWEAGWGGAIEKVSSDSGAYGPEAWPGAQTNWGASASSLSIAGGLITLEDLEKGKINHALAMALPDTRAGVYALPAQRTDGGDSSSLSLPEGAHLRLDPNLNLASLHLPRVTLMMAEAAQRYGIVVRDSASNVALYAQDPTPTGSNPYTGAHGYFEGKSSQQLLESFPWSHLQLLKMELHG
jgi:hypothetical protein